MFFVKTAIFTGNECDDDNENSRCSTVASKNIMKKNPNCKVQYTPEQLKQINSFFS